MPRADHPFRTSISRDVVAAANHPCRICGGVAKNGRLLCWECIMDEEVTYVRPLEDIRRVKADDDSDGTTPRNPDGRPSIR